MASLSLVFDLLAVDNASPAFRNVGNEAEKAGKKTSAFGSLTSKAMASAAGAIAGIGIGSTLLNATRAASDLNQTLSTSSVIFGQNAGVIERWARGASRSVGLSTRAATEAAVGFGDMFQQLGFSNDAATSMSTSTVQLAADLGAFRNLPTADVVQRITAAFRGEYDSLQLLIPNISAARVEQEAMTATGKASADALTAQEKAAATLAIVQRDGAKAAGAFAREADGLAGSQQTLAAEWENAQARLGELLVGPVTGIVKALTNGVIPAFETTVEVVGAAADIIGDIPTPVLAAVAAFAAFRTLRGPVSSAFDTLALRSLYLKDSITSATTSVGGFKGAVGGLVGAINPATIAVAAFTAGIAKVLSDQSAVESGLEVAAEAGREFRSALAGAGGVLDETSFSAGQLAIETAGLADALDELGISSGDALAALAGDQGQYDDILASLQELDAQASITQDSWWQLFGTGTVAAMDRVSGKATESADKFREMRGTLEGVGEVTVVSTGAFGRWAAAQDVAQAAAAETTAATEEATAALTDMLVSAANSWDGFVGDVELSLAEYAAQLEEQIANQENWRANLVTISQRGGTEVAQILAEMGEDGANITAQMASATEEDFQRMAAALVREAQLGGEGAAAALNAEMQVMAEIGRRGASATATEIARQLQIGVDQVRRIAAQYGINLASGINPLLEALGKKRVSGVGGRVGGLTEFWAGGYTGDGGKLEPKGVVHGGEFVLTKEQTRRAGVRNLEVYAKMLDGYAAGGFVGDSDVPLPPSTAPYRPPISTAGDAAMRKGYDEVRAWVAANVIPPNIGGPSTPNGVGGLGPAAARAHQFVRSNWGFQGTIGGYAYRTIAGTNVLSKHALGKAIDVMTYSNMALGQQIADFFAGPGRGAFGVDNVIWNRRIHSGRGWGPYFGVSPHTDHPHIDFYKTGTDFVPHDGLAYLHKGEAVVPAEQNRGGPVNVRVFIGDREIRDIVRVEVQEAGRDDRRNLRSY